MAVAAQRGQTESRRGCVKPRVIHRVPIWHTEKSWRSGSIGSSARSLLRSPPPSFPSRARARRQGAGSSAEQANDVRIERSDELARADAGPSARSTSSADHPAQEQIQPLGSRRLTAAERSRAHARPHRWLLAAVRHAHVDFARTRAERFERRFDIGRVRRESLQENDLIDPPVELEITFGSAADAQDVGRVPPPAPSEW